jgi:nucleoside-diphosphate-sugar epimerase
MEADMENRLALVLGATGGIGSAVATRLVAAGWKVRALHRSPGKVQKDSRFEWIKGDAMIASDVRSAAQGAALIVHAVNPPGYKDWDKLVLPMLDNSIAAAKASGARILFPGTVYNYGPDAPAEIAEDAPQNPVTRKGKIRVEMERRLCAAGVNVLIVRAGDYFGPGAANNWFSMGLITPGRRPTAITYPGKRGIGHQWAYLPDVAETMVRLVESDGLADVARYHLDGHWDADGTRMIGAIRRVLGDRRLPVKRTPWLVMRLVSPFVPMLRELMEMKYLWERPVRIRGKAIESALGEEPRTPLDEAVRATLGSLQAI